MEGQVSNFQQLQVTLHFVTSKISSFLKLSKATDEFREILNLNKTKG